ncbi:MAG: HD domain-containing protein [Myxococcota bacterium]|nr:HD domain-containing protein [Myxococcota bacterium]
MRNPSKKEISSIEAPLGTAEEFAAAIEAATGEEHEVMWQDPMSGADIGSTLNALLLTQRPDRGLDVLVRSGVMATILPEVAAMVGFGEGVRHKDVWLHTKKVLLRTPQKPNLRFAALFHDIGKVRTRRFQPNGQVTFLGHPEVGGRMFDKIADRLALDDTLRERVRFLIVSHLRASAYDGSWTDSAVRRFAKHMGAALDDLLDLSRADITSKHEDKVERGIALIDALAQRIAQIKEIDEKPKPLPTGLGFAIMEQFDIAPGPVLGTIMRRLTQEVSSGRLAVQAPFDHYLAFVEENRSLIDEKKRHRK